MSNIEIYFFLEGEAYAYRHSTYVPNIGEHVIFKGIIYKVKGKECIYNSDDTVTIRVYMTHI